MRSAIMMGCVALLMTTSAQAATLNKCIDAHGEVTYSNLPCRNAREARAVEIDPAPKADLVKPRAVKPPPIQAAPSSPSSPAATHNTTRIETHTTGKGVKAASARQCDTLTDKLGTVFDKMDQARRKGYSQDQMNKWNQEVEALEAKKQQSGCF